MAVETLFTICNTLVLPQWVLLIIAPNWKVTQKLATTYLVPLLLASVYILVLITHFSETQNGGFGSLAAVRDFFSNDYILLAGWIHYLAFDLIIGSWIVRNGQQSGVLHWLVIPCLFFTFMLGPTGFLVYRLIKTAYSSKMMSYENRELL
jgi:hypothetical protein